MSIVVRCCHSLWITALIAGCDSSTARTVVPNPLPPVADGGGVVVSGVTEEEATTFSADWEAAIQSGDVEAGKQLIWFEQIVKRSLVGCDVDAEFREAYLKGAMSSPAIAQIVEQLHANERAGGSYRLVRVVIREGQRHAVFRLLGADGSLNYHDMRLARDRDVVRADQFFIAMLGEEMADTMKRNVAPMIAQQTAIGRLTGQAKRAADQANQQLTLMNSLKIGDADRVLELYSELPEGAQGEKTMQMCRLNALAAIPDRAEDYLAALDEYASRFPDDPSLALVLIDAAVLRKDMDLMERAHRGLTLWSAGDPMLDLMVAGILANHGRGERALRLSEAIDVDALDLASAHDYRLSVAIANDEHDETLRHLTALKDRFGYEFSDLRAAKGFEGFAASPQHKRWLEIVGE